MLVTLGSPTRPRARAVAFALGATLVLVAVGAIGLAAFNSTVGSEDGGHSTRAALIDSVLGGLLIALGLFRLVRPHAPKDPSDTPRSGGSLTKSFAIGLAAMASNVTTLVLYVSAVKEAARAPVDDAERAGALAIVIAIAMLPATLPLALYSVSPKRAGTALGRLNGFLGRHSNAVTVVVCFGFGIYLLVKGVSEL
jgi:threonine/homoserine/homoserine lactone efflux protein